MLFFQNLYDFFPVCFFLCGALVNCAVYSAHRHSSHCEFSYISVNNFMYYFIQQTHFIFTPISTWGRKIKCLPSGKNMLVIASQKCKPYSRQALTPEPVAKSQAAPKAQGERTSRMASEQLQLLLIFLTLCSLRTVSRSLPSWIAQFFLRELQGVHHRTCAVLA